ncbi:NinE family protein [Yersinia enterocolitica]|nr:NinE family protein [Yersinia enterocolitica]EKN6075464.1 NinE family protein [Yersinia enterocolitica]
MPMTRRSPTQIAIDNLIFRKTSRTKPKPPIPASEIPTYDAIYPLLAKRWLRLRSRKNA